MGRDAPVGSARARAGPTRWRVKGPAPGPPAVLAGATAHVEVQPLPFPVYRKAHAPRDAVSTGTCPARQRKPKSKPRRGSTLFLLLCAQEGNQSPHAFILFDGCWGGYFAMCVWFVNRFFWGFFLSVAISISYWIPEAVSRKQLTPLSPKGPIGSAKYSFQ